MPSCPNKGVGRGNKDLSLRVLHYTQRDLNSLSRGFGDRDLEISTLRLLEKVLERDVTGKEGWDLVGRRSVSPVRAQKHSCFWSPTT